MGITIICLKRSNDRCMLIIGISIPSRFCLLGEYRRRPSPNTYGGVDPAPFTGLLHRSPGKPRNINDACSFRQFRYDSTIVFWPSFFCLAVIMEPLEIVMYWRWGLLIWGRHSTGGGGTLTDKSSGGKVNVGAGHRRKSPTERERVLIWGVINDARGVRRDTSGK